MRAAITRSSAYAGTITDTAGSGPASDGVGEARRGRSRTSRASSAGYPTSE
jgi:hypothetical protein